ncbi:MAG: pirin family protein [Planctomycetota bacterium]|jgi:redox-sensitive bicupin YhaK (pirin superfamily)
MISIRKSEDRGHADHGWLESRHTFSFAEYRDPEYMGFGLLRVINEDRVKPGEGFGTHGHRDMEIVSYVLNGVLEHKDSMGNGSQMRAGEVQIMSAGTGVTHSEFNASDGDMLHFLQMWIIPRETSTDPRYEQKAFSGEERGNSLRLVISPDGSDGSVTIGQDVKMYASLLAAGKEVGYLLPAGRAAWLQLMRGALRIGNCELSAGDGAGIQDEGQLALLASEDAEFLLWELPAI